MGNFTSEVEIRAGSSNILPQDTQEYPLQSNDYHNNGKIGEYPYTNGPQCKFMR